MCWTDVLNNLIFPLAGVFLGAFLAYHFTNRYERKKIISTIKIELLQELIDVSSMLEKLSVEINSNVESTIETEEIELDRANIDSFVNKSNYISRKLKVNEKFLTEENHLFTLIKEYDEARSVFGNYYKKTKIENLDSDRANKLFSRFFEIIKQLQDELTKILVIELKL